MSKSEVWYSECSSASLAKTSVDRTLAHQIEEFVAIAVDAKRVRQCQRDLPAGAVRDRRRLHEGFLGVRGIPEIAFEIDDP